MRQRVISRLVSGSVFITFLFGVLRGVIFLELVNLPLTISALAIKLAVFAGRKVVAEAAKALWYANVARSFFAGFAEFLAVFVVVTLTALRASENVRSAVEATMAPHHALPAERLDLLIDPS